jgi:hypothetical protein
MMNPYFQFGAALVTSLPIIAIAVTGIGIAILRRTAHPRASFFVSLGLLALLCNAVGSAGLQVYAKSFDATYISETAYAHNLLMLNTGLYFLQLAGIILITMAAFADRKHGGRNV